MGTNTISTIGTGAPVNATGDTVDQYKTAICVDICPRNSSGVPTDQGGGLGTSAYRWNAAYIDNLLLDGNTISSTDTNGDINLTPNGSGKVVTSKADINGGAIDGTPIGASSASTGSFTTLSATALGAALNAANYAITNINVDSGAIDGTTIGANSAAAATFSSMTATTVDINGGAIDGVTIGTSAVCTDLRVDNLKLDGNTVAAIAGQSLYLTHTLSVSEKTIIAGHWGFGGTTGARMDGQTATNTIIAAYSGYYVYIEGLYCDGGQIGTDNGGMIAAGQQTPARTFHGMALTQSCEMILELDSMSANYKRMNLVMAGATTAPQVTLRILNDAGNASTADYISITNTTLKLHTIPTITYASLSGKYALYFDPSAKTIHAWDGSTAPW